METKNAMQWALALVIGVAIVVLGFKYAGWLLTTFFVINCLVLIIVVLLQSGKAADLAGAFGGAGSQTAFGPRGAANVLSKATTWCAVMFMLCALALFLRTDKAAGTSSSILEKFTHTTPASAPVQPAPPATMPASTPASAPASAPNTAPSSTPAVPASSAPATGSKPASQPPAATPPPATTPTKKP
jgi:preprotein translocase subunit SecG